MATYFITAIDTGVGKTVATGLLAKKLLEKGKHVITHKIAQTGCEKISEDIVEHRKLMGIELQKADVDGITCPYLFKKPASPHLAAEKEGLIIDIAKIKESVAVLEKMYETVLVEGVGGIMVPLTSNYMVSDFIADSNYKVILVSSSKLGSINHTLLSLFHLKQRGIPVMGLIYNHFPIEDAEILENSALVFKSYLKKHYPDAFFGALLEGNQLIFDQEVDF